MEGDALDQAGDFLAHGPAFRDCGIHVWVFIFPWTVKAPEQPTRVPIASSVSKVKNNLSVFIFSFDPTASPGISCIEVKLARDSPPLVIRNISTWEVLP